MRKLVMISLAVVMLLSMIVVSGGCAEGDKEITVGNKNFTEQYLIGEMIKQLLEDRGFTVELVSDIATDVLRSGMEAGDIDICAEYTGTAYAVHLAHIYTPGIDNNELYDLVKAEEVDNGFVWLDPIWNNNTYVLVSWTDFAADNNLTSLSDLAALYQATDGQIWKQDRRVGE